MRKTVSDEPSIPSQRSLRISDYDRVGNNTHDVFSAAGRMGYAAAVAGVHESEKRRVAMRFVAAIQFGCISEL